MKLKRQSMSMIQTSKKKKEGTHFILLINRFMNLFAVIKMSCTIKSPPSQVKILHKEIIEKMKSTFSANGCELVEDGEGPTLVTVVNASRTLSDIKRDMEAAKLTSKDLNL